MENKRYHTAGRTALVDYLMRRTADKPESAEEIYRGLTTGESAPGRSSVYRQLGELCEAGTVRRFRADPAGEGFVYQYVGNAESCDRHFHLQCRVCGKVEHLHCASAEALCRHLMAEHGFSVDSGCSVLYGLCADCAGKEARREDRA